MNKAPAAAARVSYSQTERKQAREFIASVGGLTEAIHAAQADLNTQNLKRALYWSNMLNTLLAVRSGLLKL